MDHGGAPVVHVVPANALIFDIIPPFIKPPKVMNCPPDIYEPAATPFIPLSNESPVTGDRLSILGTAVSIVFIVPDAVLTPSMIYKYCPPICVPTRVAYSVTNGVTVLVISFRVTVDKSGSST